MTPAPLVSVIIAAYHSDTVIAGCLEALSRQTYRDFEAIVVNSSPEDRSREILTAEFPEVKYLEHPRRLFPHAARNRGVQVASGELLVFTDADCRGAPDWLEWLVQAAASDHELVCGAIEPGGTSWFELGIHLCKYSFRLSSMDAGPCAIAGTANACYSRKLWEAVGPFDGDRFAGDAMLSWRAAGYGTQPWFEPRAVVRHVFHPSLAAFWRERVERGTDFARARTSFEMWTRWRLATYLMAFPLLPLIQVARGGRDAFSGVWFISFLLTLPVQYLGTLDGLLARHERIGNH